MVASLEFGVFDVGKAELAPVFRLITVSRDGSRVAGADLPWISSTRTCLWLRGAFAMA